MVIDKVGEALFRIASTLAYWISEITRAKVTAYDVLFFYFVWASAALMSAYAWGFNS